MGHPTSTSTAQDSMTSQAIPMPHLFSLYFNRPVVSRPTEVCGLEGMSAPTFKFQSSAFKTTGAF